MVLKDNIVSRIKKNLKREYELGNVSKHYTFKSFCNNFKAVDQKPIERNFNCICGHPILYNYKYKHIKRDDVLILGSCCIEKYSTLHKEGEEAKRKCLDCDVIIKKNKDNLCKKCRSDRLIIEREYNNYYCKCGKSKDKDFEDCYNCHNNEKYTKQKELEEQIYQDLQNKPQRFFSYNITCKCGSPKKENYKTCYNCYTGKLTTDNTKCKCGKTKKPEYRLCYHCNLKK
jgi:hypothetical protein